LFPLLRLFPYVMLLKMGQEEQGMKASHRNAWFLTLSVIVCGTLGGVYGERVEATVDDGAGTEKAMAENLGAFAKVFSLVEQNYADPVSPDQAIFGPENNNTTPIPTSSMPLPMPACGRRKRVNTMGWV
jgi:hypothetical protein